MVSVGKQTPSCEPDRQSFEQSRNTYGSPRVRLDLREPANAVAKPRRPTHAGEGLRARQKRRFRPRTTDSRHNHKIAENWLAKVPAPDRPGQLWQSDITDIETQEGWLYLAFTLEAVRAAASLTSAGKTCSES